MSEMMEVNPDLWYVELPVPYVRFASIVVTDTADLGNLRVELHLTEERLQVLRQSIPLHWDVVVVGAVENIFALSASPEKK